MSNPSRSTAAIPRLPVLALVPAAALALVVGCLSLFAARPRFEGLVGGFFVGAGVTLLVAAGVAIAPLLWGRLRVPDSTTAWRPSESGR